MQAKKYFDKSVSLICIVHIWSVRSYVSMVQPERTWPRTFLLGVECFFYCELIRRGSSSEKRKSEKGIILKVRGLVSKYKKIDRRINAWRPRVVSIIYIAFIRLHFTFFSWRLVQGHAGRHFLWSWNIEHPSIDTSVFLISQFTGDCFRWFKLSSKALGICTH